MEKKRLFLVIPLALIILFSLFRITAYQGFKGAIGFIISVILLFVFLFAMRSGIRFFNRRMTTLFSRTNWKWRNYHTFIFIIIILVAWVFIRAQLIYKEGPRIVNKVEEYKVKNKIYPGTLEDIGVRSILHPMYLYNKDKDEYILMYSIFSFSRWSYMSQRKEWINMD